MLLRMSNEPLKDFLHLPAHCLAFDAGTSLVEMHDVVRILSIYCEKQNSSHFFSPHTGGSYISLSGFKAGGKYTEIFELTFF